MPSVCFFRPLSASQAIQQHPTAQLSGRWHKDKSESDSMQEACDVVELKWVLRRALAILNTLEVFDPRWECQCAGATDNSLVCIFQQHLSTALQHR